MNSGKSRVYLFAYIYMLFLPFLSTITSLVKTTEVLQTLVHHPDLHLSPQAPKGTVCMRESCYVCARVCLSMPACM